MTGSRDDDAVPASFDARAEPEPEASGSDALTRLRMRAGGELGRGGRGVVTAGFDPVLERNVALKRAHVASPVEEARLLREAQVMARLDHPAVAGVLDLGRDESGALVVVLPVRQGVSFLEAVKAAPPGAPPADLMRALLVAAQAMAHAHARSVVHRDLSGANVRVGEDGAVWVLDWGLAATLDEAAAGGARLGTPGASAPEVLAGQSARCSADVFSLGVLLHWLVVRAAPGGVLRRPPSCPAPLWAVVQHALQVEPSKRYPDAHAFANDLARWLDGQPVSVWKEGPLERLFRVARRTPRLTLALVVGGLVTLTLLSIAGFSAAGAQRRARVATTSLLLDAAERALQEDDVSAARSLAQEVLTSDPASTRARGVMAAVARIAPVTVLERAHTQRGEGRWTLADGGVVEVNLAQRQVMIQGAPPSPLPGGFASVRPSPSGNSVAITVSEAVLLASDHVATLSPCPPGEPIRFAAWRGDSLFALCADNHLVPIQNGATGEPLQVLGLGTLLRGPVAGDFVGPDSLLVANTEGQVAVVSLTTLRIEHVAQAGLGFIHEVVAARDGKSVLLHGERGVGVWRVAEGHLLPTSIRELDGARPEGEAGFVAWSGTREWVLNAEERLSVATNLHGRAAVAWDAVHRRVAVGDAAGTVELFALEGGSLARHLGLPRVIKSLSFSPDGRFLAVGAAGADGLQVFEVSAQGLTLVAGPWEGHPEVRGRHVLFTSPTEVWSFSWGPGPAVARFDSSLGRFVDVPTPAAPPDVRGACTDGRRVVSLDVTGGWTRAGVELARWSPVPHTVACSADLSIVVTAEGRTVHRGEHTFDAEAPVEALAVASDGRLAVCRRDGVVELRDANDAVVFASAAHDGRCGDVVFCDDERALCSVGWDGRLRVLAPPR